MPIIDFFVHLFVVIIYQPFFNVLVFFYWALDIITDGNANMGVAVILLAITIRILILPLSIRGMHTEHERIDVSKQISELELAYASDPVLLQEKKKALMRAQPRLVFSEVLNLVIQIMVALMVWRMFQTGLEGGDTELIYPIPFLQNVEQPFNLMFRGHDLGEQSIFYVIISIILLFIMETLSVIAAPKGSLSRSRALKAQIIIPIASFFLFLLMPAGKVLFLITTFTFSIFLTIYKIFTIRFELYKEKKLAPAPPEAVLVETK